MLTLTACPSCRARLQGDEPADAPCPRCESDLALARAVLADARMLQAQARGAMAAGDARAAIQHAWAAVCRADGAETRATLAAALALWRRGWA